MGSGAGTRQVHWMVKCSEHFRVSFGAIALPPKLRGGAPAAIFQTRWQGGDQIVARWSAKVAMCFLKDGCVVAPRPGEVGCRRSAQHARANASRRTGCRCGCSGRTGLQHLEVGETLRVERFEEGGQVALQLRDGAWLLD